MNFNGKTLLLKEDESSHLNFEWLAVWLKIARAWNFTSDERFQRWSSVIVLILGVLCGVTIPVLLLLQYWTKVSILWIDIVASEFQDLDTIVADSTEHLMVQLMRIFVIYYFLCVTKVSTLKDLSFNYIHYNNGLMGKTNYQNYPQTFKKLFLLFLFVHVIRSIIYPSFLTTNYNSANNNILLKHDNLTIAVLCVICHVITYCFFVAIPYISISFYISILLIRTDCQMCQIAQIVIDMDLTDSNKRSNSYSSELEMKQLNGVVGDNDNDNDNRNITSNVNKFDEIHELYDQLYDEWSNIWDKESKVWQIVLILCGLAVLSVSWMSLSFYHGHQTFDFYWRILFVLMLFCPFSMVIYLGISINKRFQMFKNLIITNILKRDSHDNLYWKENVTLKTKMDQYPIQCHLFGYPIVFSSVMSTFAVFVVSKLISLLFEIQYG